MYVHMSKRSPDFTCTKPTYLIREFSNAAMPGPNSSEHLKFEFRSSLYILRTYKMRFLRFNCMQWCKRTGQILADQTIRSIFADPVNHIGVKQSASRKVSLGCLCHEHSAWCGHDHVSTDTLHDHVILTLCIITSARHSASSVTAHQHLIPSLIPHYVYSSVIFLIF